MPSRCEFYSIIRVLNHKLIYEISAWHPKTETLIPVYREDLNGNAKCRNVYYAWAGGFTVELPNVKYKYYGHEYVGKIEKWGKCSQPLNIGCYCKTFNESIQNIKNHTKEFDYLIKKYQQKDIEDLWSLMQMYIKLDNTNKSKMELLVEGCQTRIAKDKRTYKLSKAKCQQVHDFLLSYGFSPNCVSLSEALYCIKHNIGLEDIKLHKDCKGDLVLFKYLKKQTHSVDFYNDYIYLCKKLGKNIEEQYWKYPKSLSAKHNELYQKVSTMEELEKQKKYKSYSQKIKTIAEKLRKYNTKIEDLNIFVPTDMFLIEKQAEELSQCLITNEYYKKMLHKQSFLLFIYKNKKPYATYELGFKSKKILQAYADERNRESCNVDEITNNIVKNWIGCVA